MSRSPEMEVAVAGSGAREHVLADVLGASDTVSKVYAFPGNPGIDMLPKGESVPSIGVMDVDNMDRFIKEKKIGVLVVGPESPIIQKNVPDELRQRNPGLAVVGPSGPASQFEGSKIFSHKFNAKHGIPQPNGVPIEDPDLARQFVRNNDPRNYVVKADGEAGGKGVLVTDDHDEAIEFVDTLLAGGFNNAAAGGILFQDRLPLWAPEVSDYWAIDKNGNKLSLGSAQDHKRVGEGDTGLNGGGSGAYSPVPDNLFSESHRLQSSIDTQAFIEGAVADGVPYEGFLFKGLMIHDDIAKVLEYNIRFGDPEAQVILPRWQRAGLDFHELFMAMAEGKLDKITLPKLTGSAALTIFLMADVYPNGSSKDVEIFGLEEDHGDDVMFYHGGTKRGDDGKLYTNGGRIVSATGFGPDLATAKAVATEAAGRIHAKGLRFRPDIGARALQT